MTTTNDLHLVASDTQKRAVAQCRRLLSRHEFMFVVLVWLGMVQVGCQESRPQRLFSRLPFIWKGHSHNDYWQDQPFDSAVQHGLHSFEVDVFPRNGQLLVAHTVFDLNTARRIDNLYVQPILSMMLRQEEERDDLERVRDFIPAAKILRGGSRKQQGKPLLLEPTTNHLSLLVDFKGDAQKSAMLLQEQLAPLRPYLSMVDRKGNFRRGRITVLVSGNRPNEKSLKLSTGERFLFIDGRTKDISESTDTNLVPLVSVAWRDLHVARLLGRSQHVMQRLAHEAHSQGKLLRIWGAPNDEKVWRQMVHGDIDLLSVDDHAKFARFAQGFRNSK
jgi:hypothetical protein